MKRRQLHTWALASASAAALPIFAQTPNSSLMEAAAEYFYPVYEFARTRYNALYHSANPQRATLNRFTHRRQLSDHRSRAVTTPNNDTLYSSAWLDLSQTPVRIEVPPVEAGRYWSIALMDMFTNNFALLGSRVQAAGATDAVVVGPDWKGDTPPGVRVIRSPSNDVWALGRWLIYSAADASAVHRLQDSVRLYPALEGVTPPPATTQAPAAAQAEPFLALVHDMLRRNPIPLAERALVSRWLAVGIRPGEASPWQGLEPSMQAAWTQALANQVSRARSSTSAQAKQVNGWQYPAPGIGDFGQDYVLRAHIALTGLAALPMQETVYLQTTLDAQGLVLSGTQRYRLQVPNAGFGAQAFWSLSLYEIMPDGRLFFVDNPINRYAVGDRTPGLQRDAQGGFTISLQRETPVQPQELANWLPTPAGNFSLMLRAYVPTQALMEGRQALPQVTRIAV